MRNLILCREVIVLVLVVVLLVFGIQSIGYSEVTFALCLLSIVGCSGGSMNEVHSKDLLQKLETVKTERDKGLTRAKTAESARDKALRRAKIAEIAVARAETARDRALRSAETAEDAIAGIEVERDRALIKREIQFPSSKNLHPKVL